LPLTNDRLRSSFFSVRIFPICPRDLRIIINVFAQDDNRELHGVPFRVELTLYRTTSYS
jgi:hypothetical protein